MGICSGKSRDKEVEGKRSLGQGYYGDRETFVYPAKIDLVVDSDEEQFMPSPRPLYSNETSLAPSPVARHAITKNKKTKASL